MPYHYPSHDPVDADLRRELAADAAQDEIEALLEPLQMENDDLTKENKKLTSALAEARLEIDKLNDENDDLMIEGERSCLIAFAVGFAVGGFFATTAGIAFVYFILPN